MTTTTRTPPRRCATVRSPRRSARHAPSPRRPPEEPPMAPPSTVSKACWPTSRPSPATRTSPPSLPIHASHGLAERFQAPLSFGNEPGQLGALAFQREDDMVVFHIGNVGPAGRNFFWRLRHNTAISLLAGDSGFPGAPKSPTARNRASSSRPPCASPDLIRGRARRTAALTQLFFGGRLSPALRAASPSRRRAVRARAREYARGWRGRPR